MTWPDLISRSFDMNDARFFVILLLAFVVAVLWAVRPMVVAWIERRPLPAPERAPPVKPHPPPDKE